MRITLRQLEVFDAVARNASFTRAAEELYLTQPAVSMQIKQLENVLGVAVHEVVGRRVYLTEAGRTMQHYSRVIAEQLKEATQAMEELKGVEGGRVRLSVASTVNYYASRLLCAYCKRYPGVRVALDVTNREALLRALDRNETDVVLMGRPPADMDVEAVPFKDNPLVVIAAPGHPLAGKRRVALERLAHETFLMREQGSGTRIAVERHFAEQGVDPSVSVEMTSNEAIKQSVEAGLGLGVVSVHTVALELEVGRLVTLDVQGFPILRRWYVVRRRGKRLSAAATALEDFVLEAAQAPYSGGELGLNDGRRGDVDVDMLAQ